MEEVIGWLQGGSSILARAEGKLEPPFGGSGSRPKNWIAAAYGGAVAGPLVLSSGCWARRVPDALWIVRRPDASTRRGCQCSH